MFPSTGLFRGYPCPYYDGTQGSCDRAYCHYNHVNPHTNQEDSVASTSVAAMAPPPKYTPTPKLLPLPDISPSTSKRNHTNLSATEADPIETTSAVATNPPADYTPNSKLLPLKETAITAKMECVDLSLNQPDSTTSTSAAAINPPPKYTPTPKLLPLPNIRVSSSRKKHSKKPKEYVCAPTAAAATTAPKYTPTPKLLPLPDTSASGSKKKVYLEYCPEQPEFSACSTSVRPITEKGSVPVYKPGPPPTAVEDMNIDSYMEEIDELSKIMDESESNDLMDFALDPCEDTYSPQENDWTRKSSNGKKSHTENKEVANVSAEETESEIFEFGLDPMEDIDFSPPDSDADEPPKKVQSVKSSSDRKEKKRHSSERRDSCSSASRHKHKSSSKSKEKSKHKETSRDKDRKNEKRDDRSKDRKDRDRDKKSTASSRPRTSSSSSAADTKKSSSSSSKHKKSSSSSERKKDHNSSNSSSSSKQHKTIEKSATAEEQELVTPKKGFEATSGRAVSTLEPDNNELEMIYNDYLTKHEAKEPSDDDAPSSNTAKRKHLEEESIEESSWSFLQKKRVAHENADKYFKVKAPERKPSLHRSALQATYERQSILARKYEEEKAAKEAALLEAEQKVRDAREALRKAEENLTPLTPLIPKSYLAPPIKTGRSIAPVVNMIAIARAKKKVEELKAERMLPFTAAQSKKGERVAHRPTEASKALEPEKLAKPPVLDPRSTKISFNLRMQYYDMMVKCCISLYPNIADAWERAQSEELAVLNKCNTPIIYKSSCMLTINKLRKEAIDSGNKPANSKIVSHEVILAGKAAQSRSWSVQKKQKTEAATDLFDQLPAEKAYDMVYDLCLTEEQLVSNGFPRVGPRPGTAIIKTQRPMRRPNESERYCSRCGKIFSTSIYDEVCTDLCNYHPKNPGYHRGFADNLHRCCQAPAGSPGCTYANYHVTDFVDLDNLTGYVTTLDKGDGYVPTKKDIFAVDCEMCYTTHGMELTRVTVVDINCKKVYDALIKPENKVVDYNTTYSGITEDLLGDKTTTLHHAQAVLLSLFHSKTILVGHSLESDLKALKIIHSTVVDTSVLFPHKMGPPKKRALKTLCTENLKRIIQESESGHDSFEDAEVCIQLIKFFLRNSIT